ncbi:hydantoinase/oxoprolinase family protein [Pseudorhodobacter turbinis]|uniref:Hydantoinase/oxoprolinase family protein n=1 Tax=Pseudorhodobacter turbinis TaxID=2500533 RepID=A0A4P8EH07_9RHOB|nr:hydantoinase/oxoprolinase family protein [Pseudorhodobacter turbinis]QCO56441.1 hydantoinase/oxoprolinase family protein [Pseudorhodobacter turbinis]
MSYAGKQVRVGVDIGGTFTDVAMEIGTELHSTKVLTNYTAPEQAILDGLQRVAKQAGIETGDIDLVIHGTTLATNALIERRGAKTAFLTTKGFRDVIEMRTENRFEQYDLNIVLPAPLIARDSRYVAAGRIGASGRELAPLDEAAVARFARDVAAKGYESIAVGFVHSYVNPAHEERAREIITEHAPDLSVSISSEVSPQMREFERFNTVCANAFVKPLIASYLNRLVVRLAEIGADCPVYMIHSGGGLISVDTAANFPVRLLESGPAGGAIYAADVAARHGLRQILSYDMGGTTAKICLVEDFTPKTARTFEVARTYRFKKGSGMPISIPVIEMVEIGAGGGSLAHVDGMRQIRVGPESAGSEPGPACYGRGGDKPAVTDADLVLGKLDPDNFAGGDIKLTTQSSVDALLAQVGQKLGMNAEKAAVGVVEVVDESMAAAARVHAVENGKELGDFTMIAYGGAAPLHANRLCEKLGINALLIPPGAGVGSAIGFLRAPFGYEAVRGAYMKLSQYNAEWVNEVLGGLEAESVRVARDGAGDVPLEIERKAYMRYVGQGWEIPVVLPNDRLGADGASKLRSLFEAEYIRLFGNPLEGLDVEVMNWSVKAASRVAAVTRVDPVAKAGTAPVKQTRQIFDAKEVGFLAASVINRSDMSPGIAVNGPAAIVERETTTIVTAAYEAILQSDGCLLIQKKGAMA